jgi:predicted AAA+ superfamily ATPase
MIRRDATNEFHQLLQEYPVVTLLGPRQSGKTTLAQSLLPGYAYANLESPETLQFAAQDPKAFLARFTGNVILDEIQRLPELLSYIQVIVDQKQRNGQFVLTGSHQLALREAITQSLAGRTSILHLYPFSMHELSAAGIHLGDFEHYLHTGFLPRIHDQQQRPTTAYANYYQTYVERDVRQLINLKDFALFDTFMRLVAGRAGQLMDYSTLAKDVGVNAKTIKHWLSILEASFILFKLPPFYQNFGKRMVKSPKYYFVEPGLLTYLLNIETPAQARRDPLVGQLFENMIVSECLKARANAGKPANLYFYRDSNGNEVDLLWQEGHQLVAMEIKSSATYQPKQLKGIKRLKALTPDVKAAYLVYAGEAFTFSDQTQALPFDQIDQLFTKE